MFTDTRPSHGSVSELGRSPDSTQKHESGFKAQNDTCKTKYKHNVKAQI